ncbi:MAG: DNA-binding MarR family transcriptional regulator [Porticoccaceae bacterium]|jgi:DNA-binding MarR family transcriptional regulator
MKEGNKAPVGSSVDLDHETRLVEDDHHSIRLWLRLLTCTNLIEGQLRTSLREEFNTTLPRFDFLAQLERNPDGLTMSELSRRTMVSGGNVSGIARQLEQDGMISRVSVPTDKRSFIVSLTADGRREFVTMAARHEEWIIGMFQQLDASEVEELNRLLGKLKYTATAQISRSLSMG